MPTAKVRAVGFFLVAAPSAAMAHGETFEILFVILWHFIVVAGLAVYLVYTWIKKAPHFAPVIGAVITDVLKNFPVTYGACYGSNRRITQLIFFHDGKPVTTRIFEYSAADDWPETKSHDHSGHSDDDPQRGK